MKTDLAKIANNCFRLSVQHETWQSLGFSRRPARSAIFRLAKPAWKAALENRIYRELLVIFSAAHIEGIRTDREGLLRQLVRFYWDDRSGSFSPLFRSRDSCLNAIHEYIDTPISKWPEIFVERLNVFALPDGKLKQLILARRVAFMSGVGETILSIRRSRDLKT